eukprot:1137222-Pelagomonas_calceolata.AAC.18
MLQVKINKKEVGQLFKKYSKAAVEALESMSECEAMELKVGRGSIDQAMGQGAHFDGELSRSANSALGTKALWRHLAVVQEHVSSRRIDCLWVYTCLGLIGT